VPGAGAAALLSLAPAADSGQAEAPGPGLRPEPDPPPWDAAGGASARPRALPDRLAPHSWAGQPGAGAVGPGAAAPVRLRAVGRGARPSPRLLAGRFPGGVRGVPAGPGLHVADPAGRGVPRS